MISSTGARIPAADGMKSRNSFTLIEILLVVVIIAVIAALAVPNFGGIYARIQLRKAADDLAYHMRYAQSYAITKNTLTRLEFDPFFTQYWLTRQSGDETTQDVFEKISGRMGGIISIPHGAQISFGDDDPAMLFYPDGTMDKRRISLCHDEECFLISTQKQRGQVHVLKQSDENP